MIRPWRTEVPVTKFLAKIIARSVHEVRLENSSWWDVGQLLRRSGKDQIVPELHGRPYDLPELPVPVITERRLQELGKFSKQLLCLLVYKHIKFYGLV